MINYDKWKLLNENFMISQPLGGVRSKKGYFAYNKLTEDEDGESVMHDEEEMDHDEDDLEDDEEEMDHDEDDLEDDEEEMDHDEDDLEDDEEEMDHDEDDLEDDEEEMDHDEDDLEDDEEEMDHDEDDLEDDEEEMDHDEEMGHHHHHHHHHHHDEDEFDHAERVSEKFKKYDGMESTNYEMPSMNEWLDSVKGMLYPEEIKGYIGANQKYFEANEESEIELPAMLKSLENKLKSLDKQNFKLNKTKLMQTLNAICDMFVSHAPQGLTGNLRVKYNAFKTELEKSVGEDEESTSEPANKATCGSYMSKGKHKKKRKGHMHGFMKKNNKDGSFMMKMSKMDGSHKSGKYMGKECSPKHMDAGKKSGKYMGKECSPKHMDAGKKSGKYMKHSSKHMSGGKCSPKYTKKM